MIESKTKNLSLQKEKKIQIQFNSTSLNIPSKMLPRFLRHSHVYELNKSKKKRELFTSWWSAKQKELGEHCKTQHNLTQHCFTLPYLTLNIKANLFYLVK